MQKLTQVITNEATHYSPCFEVEVHREKIKLSFEITKIQGNFEVNPDFRLDDYKNWGLWEFDVIEIFVTKNLEKLPYLEFELSPLNQTLALIISEPRKKFDYPGHLPIVFQSEILGQTWQGQIEIPMDFIPGDGPHIFGNVFACLGKKDSREYYAAFNHQDGKLDFHRPEHFDRWK